MMKILVVGCGGIGGYFGGRLLEAENDVTFLVREKRAQHLLQNGLNIESCRGNMTQKVMAITKDEVSNTYDLIILTCKSYDLTSCLNDIRPAIGRNTVLLPLLNGLQHYETLTDRFGLEKVLYGYCNISAGIDEDGGITHFNAIHELTIGCDTEIMCGEKYQSVLSVLNSANFNTRSSKAIWQELWEKFVFISALAGFTTLLRADVGTIVSTQEGHSIITMMLEECQRIAKAAGYSVSKRADKLARHAMLQPKSTFSASMLKDMLANKRVESDALIGDMIKYSHRLNLSSPLLCAAYSQLETYTLKKNLEN